MRKKHRFLAAVIAVLSVPVLGGCGDGQGGDTDPATAPLTSRAGAVREIGMLGQILADGAPLFGAARAEPLFADLQFTASPNGPSRSCAGGSVTTEEGERDESLRYFAAMRRFAYTRDTFSDCTRQNARATIRQHGVVEYAAEAQHDPANLADSYDYYAEYGDDTESYVYEVAVFSSTPVPEEVSGRFEWRDWDYGREVRSVLTRRAVRTPAAGGDLLIRQGRTDAPFSQPPVLGAGVSIDGPYTYDSEVCGFATRSVVGQLERSDRAYPRNGQLTISTPEGDSLTAVFDAEGNATLNFSDGGSATLEASEVEVALDAPVC